MTPNPLTFTLFPYTTLFRSFYAALKTEDAFFSNLKAQAESEKKVLRYIGKLEDGKAAITQFTDVTQYFFLTFGLCLDRKSTRLNSSHLGISYAVLCLKKKRT